MSENTTRIGNAKDLRSIRKINWSSKFERLMRNRLVMGYFRYGPLNKQVQGQYNNIQSIMDRANLYKRTGNDEILVDIANIAMVEFKNGLHPKKHFKSVDDGIHTQQKGEAK